MFDGDRVRVPAHLVRLTKLDGDSSLDCWLLVVTPGRYRLVPPSIANKSDTIAAILNEIEEIQEPGDVLAGTESNERAALPARLIHTTASPDENRNWRVTIPEEARMLVPDGKKQRFVFITSSHGFIEFWFPETLKQALSAPISDAVG